MESIMRKALILTVAGVASIVAFSAPATARDGCGNGWHRDRYGACRANHDNRRYYRSRDAYSYDRGYAADDRAFYPETGTFYEGRGYWNGDQYYMNRSGNGRGYRYW